jgi:tRNA wybutosine-synthesizing protein 3
MNLEQDFLDGKKIALQKLEKACRSGEVDSGILPILHIINKTDYHFTSSSCYGRIVVLEIPSIGDKKNAEFLGKWHREINYDELIGSINKAKAGQIWLLSQSPVIHVISKTPESADKLLKNAISCGFKHSGLKSFGKKIVVEICSTERLDAPIGNNGKLFCNEDHLRLLLDISNEIIKKSTHKLKKLEKSLKDL